MPTPSPRALRPAHGPRRARACSPANRRTRLRSSAPPTGAGHSQRARRPPRTEHRSAHPECDRRRRPGPASPGGSTPQQPDLHPVAPPARAARGQPRATRSTPMTPRYRPQLALRRAAHVTARPQPRRTPGWSRASDGDPRNARRRAPTRHQQRPDAWRARSRRAHQAVHRPRSTPFRTSRPPRLRRRLYAATSTTSSVLGAVPPGRSTETDNSEVPKSPAAVPSAAVPSLVP